MYCRHKWNQKLRYRWQTAWRIVQYAMAWLLKMCFQADFDYSMPNCMGVIRGSCAPGSAPLWCERGCLTPKIRPSPLGLRTEFDFSYSNDTNVHFEIRLKKWTHLVSPFKVTQGHRNCTDRSRAYEFLWTFHSSHLVPFQDTARYWPKIEIFFPTLVY